MADAEPKLDTSEIDKLLAKGDDDEIAKAVQWLRQIVYADPARVMGADRKVLMPDELPEEIRPAIKRVSFTRANLPSYEFHDPFTGLDRLAKILGWYQANQKELSPLEEMYQRIPREKLKLALEFLVLFTSPSPSPPATGAEPEPEEDDGDDEIHPEHGKIARLVEDDES